MTINNRKAHINGLIDEIKAAEKITKVKLGILSRDILMYVIDTDDIASVNRLLSVLTPMNKRTAELFFMHFLPWDAERNVDNVFQQFGKKTKGDKKLTKSLARIKEFLADEANNIWTWANENVDIERKKKDFAGLIQKSIASAIKGDENTDTPPLDREDIMKAVFAGGVSIDDMLSAIQMQEQKLADELAVAEAIMNAPVEEAA